MSALHKIKAFRKAKNVDSMMQYAKENIKFYQLSGRVKSVVDDKTILMESENLLNQEFMYYPYRDNIRILHGFSEDGVYRRIYWLNEDLKRMEEPVWKLRNKVAGITKNMRFCSFYTTKYRRNTLLNPCAFYQERNRLFICKDQLIGNKIVQTVRFMEEFDPEWIQMEEAVAEILMEYYENYTERGLRPQYIEIINSDNEILSRRLMEQFGCIVRRTCNSLLFGTFAYEDSRGRLLLLNENVTANGNDGGILLSTKSNRAMPVLNYPVKYKIHSAEGYEGEERFEIIPQSSHVHRLFFLPEVGKICADLLYRPIEFINERIGKIINQVQILQQEDLSFSVNMNLNPSYAGWRDEIKKIFGQYIGVDELASAGYEFFFCNTFFDWTE